MTRPHAIVTAILLALFALTAPAAAQGTSDTLPDPISSNDLDRWASWLELTEQQRLAIDPFHDDYRTAFKSLREGDIEAFMEDFRGLRQGFMQIPNSEQIEDLLDQSERLLGRIRTLDERLFAGMDTVLTEEQQLKMTRVRQARDRERYRSNLMEMVGFLNPACRVDLSEIARDIEMSPAEFAMADPLIEQYERRLTSNTHRAYDAATKMILDLLETLEANGFTPESFEGNRRAAFDAMGILRDAWTEASKDMIDESFDMSDLNRRTTKSVMAVLEAANARSFERRFFDRAYREGRYEASADRRFDRAERMPLSDDQRSQITALRAAFDSDRRAIRTKLADLVDEDRRDSNPMDFSRFGRGNDDDEVDAQRDRLVALDADMSERLDMILGAELVARVNEELAPEAASEPREARSGRITANVRSGRSGRTETAQVTLTASPAPTAGGDPYLPGPIRQVDVDAYAAMLELRPDQREIIDALHLDYASKFDTIRDEHLDVINEKQREMWTLDRDSGRFSPPAFDDIDAIYQMRETAFEAIAEIDRGFFEDVEFAVLDPEQGEALERVRLMRQRAVFNRAPSGQGGRGPGWTRFARGDTKETQVDVATLLGSLELSANELQSIDATLKTYEREIADAFRKRYEVTIDVQRDIDTITAQVSRDGGDRRFSGEEIRRVIEQGRNRTRDANANVLAFNRRVMDDLTRMLQGTNGVELRRVYNRRSFPGVYDDPDAADRYLREAMSLGDLTGTQRAGLGEIAAEYHAPYEALCERMISLEAEGTDPWSWDPDVQRSNDERRSEVEQVEFERDELNARTLRRLRTVLTERQAESVGLARTD